MSGLNTLFGAFYSLGQRFSGRLDSEHEQAFLRLAIGVVLGCYFGYFTLFSSTAIETQDLITAAVMVGFLAFSTSLIIAIAIQPRISPARRLFGIALDAGTITYFSFAAPTYATPLYCVYLWIIFGHGFRFGIRYLFFALALSFIGFGYVVFTLPFWLEQRSMGLGLWIGMLVVSLYISTLVRRLTTALEDAEAAKKKLIVALQSADEANHAKRRFLSTISHEMRTPLNAIIGMGHLLRSTQLAEDQAEMAQTMDTASRMLLSLIEGVLDFSKIEAGKLVVEHTQFSFHHLAHITIAIFKYQAKERGLILSLDIEPGVPTDLVGDPHHLRQIMVNLLANAMKFTERGEITLRIRAIANEAQSVRLRVEVIDTGIGIAADKQLRIFESFTQADESTTRRFGGTGLGTTISKQLVELMGGTIGLHSELGVGSTFWFELTLAKQTATGFDCASNVFPLGQSKQPKLTPNIAIHRKLSVLVADDNTINQQVVKRILERNGHSCVLVENGEQALDKLMDGEFDAVVLDMNMPVLNGIDAAKAYQFMTSHDTRAPIIMFSADVTTEVIEECRMAGVDRFISKPIEVALFLKTVETLADKFANHKAVGRSRFQAKLDMPIHQAQPTQDQTEELLSTSTLAQLESLGENNMFVSSLIIAFKRDTIASMSKLESALLMQNTEELRELFHAMRGAAASIGAVAMRHTCHMLEHKTRAEILDGGLRGLEPLKRLYILTCTALDDYLMHTANKRSH